MPDFFEGNPADISWYPPDNEEKGKKLGAFFKGPAAPPKVVTQASKAINALKKDYPNITSWVSFTSFCRDMLTGSYRELWDIVGVAR
jgi:hypothetical protein